MEMKVVMIDGPMITNFIEDSATFEKYANEKFQLINQSEGKFPGSLAFEQEETQDEQFQVVDLDKYKEELKEIMKVVAHGIGNTPVNVLVDEGSLLLKAYEMDIERLKKKYEDADDEDDEEPEQEQEQEHEHEQKIKTNVVEENNNNNTPKKVIYAPKKNLKNKKKKKSFDLFNLNLCSCSGKHFIVDEKN